MPRRPAVSRLYQRTAEPVNYKSETNIFGKSLNELVNEELSNKLARMPADARDKFRETLEKIINESTGGLICILL